MPLKVRKQIYDNVHGYIGFTDLELGIIDNPLFQRLRNVAQMGPSYLVFPGATHTRFEHSIGTMFMMDQFLMHVKKGDGPITEDPDVIEKMRIVALLHDVGHYPMSHTLEHVITRRMGGKSHTEFGAEIIEKFFSKSLSNYKIREITDMISGKDRSELAMLISSAFDADKCDYLLRDSYHTGVGYGKLGMQRLIRIASFEKNKIIFDKDQVAVESFLVGRYHMYRSVYYHKTITAFQLMLERIFELLVQEGYIVHPKEILKSGSELDIFTYNDHMLYNAMAAYLSKGRDGYLKELIRMYLLRKPLSAAYINAVPMQGKDTSAQNIMIKEMVYNDDKTKAFAKRNGIDEWKWVFPAYLRPLSLIDEDTAIYVKDKGSVKPLIDSNALVLQMVGKMTLYDARIYTNPKYKAKLQSGMGVA